MAYIWREIAGGGWQPLELTVGDYAVRAAGVAPLSLNGPAGRTDGSAAVLRASAGAGGRWLLLASSDVRLSVNGRVFLLGLHCLRDRDEIAIGGPDSLGAARFYFSLERLPRAVPFAADQHATRCPRCKDIVQPENLAVECPTCGAWYHQLPERPCFSASDRCFVCSGPTELEAGFRWTPEEL